jgi:hypothetical protein
MDTDYHLLRESRYSHARGDYGDQGQRYFPHDARAHHAATHLTAHHVGNTVVGGAVGGSIAAAVGGPGVVDHGQGGHGPSHDNERVHHHHAHADAEKAAAKRGTGIFARRGAHDDPDAPAEGGRFFDRFKKRKPDGTVFPPVGDEAEAPADADIAENRISNATMVDINEDYHTPGTHFPHEPVVHPIPAAEEAYLDSNPNPDSAVPVHPTPAAGQVHPNPAVHPNDTPVVPSTKH